VRFPEDLSELKKWLEQRTQLEERLGNEAKSMFGLGGIATVRSALLTALWLALIRAVQTTAHRRPLPVFMDSRR
jgi:hypothetical protein